MLFGLLLALATVQAPVDPALDFPALRGMCAIATATALPTASQLNASAPAAPPTRVFDNLYYVGSQGVSSWAVATSGGIILIDALNNGEEARTIIEPGLRRLGLDPARIRFIIVTHAHGDHYGGVRYLAERYHPRVVMSEADWQELARPRLQFDSPNWGRPPERDMAVRDGERLTLGETSIELRVTRTHTPGTISPIITVTDGRARHRVMLWGGTAFNFGLVRERLDSYAAEADRMRRIAAARGVDAFVANHPGADGSRRRFELLRARGPRDPHPYVIGRARVGAILARMAECARTNAAAIEAAPAG